MNHGDAGSWDDQKVHLEESHTTPSQSLPSQSWKVLVSLPSQSVSKFTSLKLVIHPALHFSALYFPLSLLCVPLDWSKISIPRCFPFRRLCHLSERPSFWTTWPCPYHGASSVSIQTTQIAKSSTSTQLRLRLLEDWSLSSETHIGLLRPNSGPCGLTVGRDNFARMGLPPCLPVVT
ncbi:hypothetical protein PISMIDRAFT_272290 [Pisolithus microcarpus 441]|uniref:Uncharacterized protein n=1 Tax=Pisolithus microcarpus 441 TaxID=765257 RepID=A0A0C9ZK48_9AGAM|nr:hypothetical protein PISMIDRAFT_272290 [Pisolithus microcarpus 441]